VLGHLRSCRGARDAKMLVVHCRTSVCTDITPPGYGCRYISVQTTSNYSERLPLLISSVQAGEVPARPYRAAAASAAVLHTARASVQVLLEARTRDQLEMRSRKMRCSTQEILKIAMQL